MARVKGAMMARKRRNKTLKLAKGYWGAKSKQYRAASEQVARSLRYAFKGRKLRKRDFRSLWITRINAAARLNGMSYSTFIRCEAQRSELLHLHARSEGRRHPDQPQDAVRDGHQRSRGVYRPVRDREEGVTFCTNSALSKAGRCFSHFGAGKSLTILL